MTVLSIFTRLLKAPIKNITPMMPSPSIEQGIIEVEESGVYKAKVCRHEVHPHDQVVAGVSVLSYSGISFETGERPSQCLECRKKELLRLSIACPWCEERIVPGATVSLRKPAVRRKHRPGTVGHYLGTKLFLAGCLSKSCATGNADDIEPRTERLMVGTLQKNKTIANVRPNNGTWQK